MISHVQIYYHRSGTIIIIVSGTDGNYFRSPPLLMPDETAACLSVCLYVCLYSTLEHACMHTCCAGFVPGIAPPPQRAPYHHLSHLSHFDQYHLGTSTDLVALSVVHIHEQLSRHCCVTHPVCALAKNPTGILLVLLLESASSAVMPVVAYICVGREHEIDTDLWHIDCTIYCRTVS